MFRCKCIALTVLLERKNGWNHNWSKYPSQVVTKRRANYTQRKYNKIMKNKSSNQGNKEHRLCAQEPCTVSPTSQLERSTHSLQLEKACVLQQRHSAAMN